MNLILKTAPIKEPLDILEVFEYLKLNPDDVDTAESLYITALITTSRKYCENFQNRAYITQIWEASFDYWPGTIIELPKGNLQAATIDEVVYPYIKYTDYAGVITTLSNTEYVVSTRSIKGRITPAYGKSWPVFIPYPLDAIIITFACGYGATAATIPETVKQSMYLLISHWHENRIPVDQAMVNTKEVEFTISALLTQDRLVNV